MDAYVGTDALVLKHQAISTHSADDIFTVVDQLDTERVWL